MPSCSEGSRGLSVLPQVARIFTNNAISPGPWSRQRPSRYAVRAGRNLPDKEFRFLDHGSPDRLGMLYPPTCVGFGTGACGARPRGFSRRHGICCFARRGFVSRLGLWGSRTCLAPGLRAFTGTSRTPHSMPFRVAARARARRRRYGNVRPLRIGYACRPRLSPRLTLGGLASPRKPWACGGRVSRSSLATHASILASAPSTGGRPSGFAQRGTLPYRCS